MIGTTEKDARRLSRRAVLAGLAAAAGATLLAACGGSSKATIKVGSKDFTEEFIVGNMYALLLENAGFKVDRKLNLGGTPVCQAAMQKGDLDLYPEYTGTGLLTVLKLPSNTDAKMVYDQVSKGYKDQFNFVWLDPAPMNDTQALAMTGAGSQKFGITKISDIVGKADQLTMIGPPEFETREDGLPGIMKAYGAFKLKKYIGVDPGLKYKGLLDGQADIAVAFSTDGDIAVNKLVVLQDDKKLFPIYQITPVVTQKALDASPGIKDALNKVAPLLTDQVMSTLNYEVDGKKRDPADVAKEFLTNQGLLKK
ncbi:MAG: glycine betaine ABC transporter substrate-binding protein [Thermomicrobiales bacterium]